MKPDRKLTPKDFFAVLADRYHGTKYDHYDENKADYKPVQIEHRSMAWSLVMASINASR